MLRHSLMNENARALPVGALATYALRTLNGTSSTVSPEESAVTFTAAYHAASFDLRLTQWVAILQNSPTYFHAGYLSTILGLKSEF